MIKVENLQVFGWEAAIRGMRKPLDSERRFDTDYTLGKYEDNWSVEGPKIGENDLGLMKRLYKSGPEHAKYLRMIHVQLDITCPLSVLKELDTYKVATTFNSRSTMHTIHKYEFTRDMFSTSDEYDKFTNPEMLQYKLQLLDQDIAKLNKIRGKYLEQKSLVKTDPDNAAEHTGLAKWWWRVLVDNLPEEFDQTRTWDINYQTVINIIHQRQGHKLKEWRDLIDVFKTLPYVQDLLDCENE